MKRWILLLCICVQLQASTLHRVILATDANPDYVEFWPIVAQAWSEIVGIRPTLALIAEDDVAIDETLGDVIRFKPIEGIPTSLQAQVIRLLLPTLYPDDVCILSDIDMVPLNKSYFVDSITKCADDSFIVYRNKAYQSSELKYPMCYMAARGSTYGEVFHVQTMDDIREKIIALYKLDLGWNTDELVLYQHLHDWQGFDTRCVFLDHDVQRRLDRSYWRANSRMLHAEGYIDAHCPRPYSKYKNSIDGLVHKKYTKLRNIYMYPYDHHLIRARSPLGDLRTTGEVSVIRSFIKDGDTVFDIGANCGDWTRAVLNHVEPQVMHAFEPIPSVAGLFSENISHDCVALHEIALSRASGIAPFYYYPRCEGISEDGVLSSLFQRHRVESLFNMEASEIEVPVTSLDEFCQERDISHIDFVKIDTEGAEYDILLGARELLRGHHIDFIQFEYGQTYVDSKRTLKDVYQLLTAFGYAIFKVHINGILHVKKWSEGFENFYQSNYLAISPEITNYSYEFEQLQSASEEEKRALQEPDNGTHMALLLTAITHTTGPILEMGAGDYSTPLLHAVCSRERRPIVTADTDYKILFDFIDLQGNWHHFAHVPVYEDDKELNPRPTLWDMIGNGINWSVVLINHRPGERRVADIERLRANTAIFVVHDTQEPGYNYGPLLDTFKYRYTDERYATQTTLVSDVVDVARFFD